MEIYTLYLSIQCFKPKVCQNLQVKKKIFFLERGSHYVACAELELLHSCDPPTSASQTRATVPSCEEIFLKIHVQALLDLLKQNLQGRPYRFLKNFQTSQ